MWHGDNNSCCDIKRQMSKLHTTPNLPANVSNQEKLLEKCRSYALTDANTPFMGDYVRAVLRSWGTEVAISEKTQGMRIWNSDLDDSIQYPNTQADWMFTLLREQLPTLDYDQFMRDLEERKSVFEYMSMPVQALPLAPKVAMITVVDGEEVAGPAVIPFDQEQENEVIRTGKAKKRARSQNWKNEQSQKGPEKDNKQNSGRKGGKPVKSGKPSGHKRPPRAKRD